MANILVEEVSRDFYYIEFEFYVDGELAGEATIVKTYADQGRFDEISMTEAGEKLASREELTEAYFEYLNNFAGISKLEMRSKEFKEMPWGFFPCGKEETPRGTIYIYSKDLSEY